MFLFVVPGLGRSAEEGEPVIREEQEEALGCVREPPDQRHLSGVDSGGGAQASENTALVPSRKVHYTDVGSRSGRARPAAAAHQLHRPGRGIRRTPYLSHGERIV